MAAVALPLDSRGVALLHAFESICDKEGRLVDQHFVGEFEALQALQLLVLGPVAHRGVVLEDAHVHVLLQQLEPVLVCDLARDETPGLGLQVLSEELQDL